MNQKPVNWAGFSPEFPLNKDIFNNTMRKPKLLKNMSKARARVFWFAHARFELIFLGEARADISGVFYP
jgi:hypothetical protein